MKKLLEWDITEYGCTKIIDKDLPKIETIPYYREIELNIEEIYMICKLYYVIDEDILRQGIFGAFLLKFIYDKKIKLIKEDKDYYFEVLNKNASENKVEKGLYNIFLHLIDKNSNKFDEKKLNTYIEKNPSKITSWYNDLEHESLNSLVNKGLLEKVYEKRRDKTTFSRKTVMYKKDTSALKNEIIKIIGLKKYLLDFSKLNEKSVIEVHLWHKYLMVSEILGIADEVKKSFYNIYPELKENNIQINFVNEISKNIINDYIDIQRRIEIKKSIPNIFSKSVRNNNSTKNYNISSSTSSSGRGHSGGFSGGSSGGGFSSRGGSGGGRF